MSSSQLFLANALLTLPFGVIGYLAPVFTFGQFGLTHLDAPSQALVRGYASTALGYGWMMLGLRNSQGEAEYVMLVATATFNAAESLLQGHCIISDIGCNQVIWSTFIPHTALAIWSIYRIFKYSKGTDKKKKT